MKIKYIQTGGFAGLTKIAEIDTDKLSANEAEVYKKFIKESDFFNIPSIDDSRSLPDVENIIIKVEDEGKSHSVRFNILNIPNKLKPLVDNLQKLAKIKKR